MRQIYEAVVIVNGHATEPYKFRRAETRDGFVKRVREQGYEVRLYERVLFTALAEALLAWRYVDRPRLTGKGKV